MALVSRQASVDDCWSDTALFSADAAAAAALISRNLFGSTLQVHLARPAGRPAGAAIKSNAVDRGLAYRRLQFYHPRGRPAGRGLVAQQVLVCSRRRPPPTAGTDRQRGSLAPPPPLTCCTSFSQFVAPLIYWRRVSVRPSVRAVSAINRTSSVRDSSSSSLSPSSSPVHCKNIRIYAYFLECFPYFNRIGSVYVCIRRSGRRFVIPSIYG